MRYDLALNAYVFNKGEKEALGAHFTTTEFQCQCSNADCIVQYANKGLVDKLNEVREEHALPIRLNSAYRCHKHQLELAAGGKETAKGVSQHELGKAVDLSSKDMLALQTVLNAKFKAMGVARSFIHVDMREDTLRRWSYVKE